MASMRIWALAATLALQSAVAGAAPAQAAGTPEARTGQAAVDALVGNTVVGGEAVDAKPRRPGAENALYLLADGTGWAASRDRGVTVGLGSVRWRIQDDGQLCLFIMLIESTEACGPVSIAGGTVTLARPGWAISAGKIQAGNAWNLINAYGTQPSLSGKAAADALAGNTLVARKAAGQELAIYFLADGTGKTVLRRPGTTGEPQSFRWRIGEDGRMCRRAKQQGTEAESCTKTSILGDTVELIAPDRSISYYQLLQGNARAL